MAQTICPWSPGLIAPAWRRSGTIVIGRRSMWHGRGSFWRRPIGPMSGRSPAHATVAACHGADLRGTAGDATHWTGWAMAKTTGLSLRTVQRICEAAWAAAAPGAQLQALARGRLRQQDRGHRGPSRPGAMPLGCRNIPGWHGRNWTVHVSIVTRIRSD
jgi:hypothetical protein